MGGQGVQAQSVTGIRVQTAPDHVLELGAQLRVPRPVGQPQQDLAVRLKGDVATHHVVQQDAQGPDCQSVCRVPSVFDPLRGGVDSGSCSIEVSWTTERETSVR